MFELLDIPIPTDLCRLLEQIYETITSEAQRVFAPQTAYASSPGYI